MYPGMFFRYINENILSTTQSFSMPFLLLKMNLSANLFAEVHNFFVCVRRMYMGIKLALHPFVASDIEEMSDNKGRLYTLNLRKHRERSLLTYTYRKELPFLFCTFFRLIISFLYCVSISRIEKNCLQMKRMLSKKVAFFIRTVKSPIKREREKKREKVIFNFDCDLPLLHFDYYKCVITQQHRWDKVVEIIQKTITLNIFLVKQILQQKVTP